MKNADHGSLGGKASTRALGHSPGRSGGLMLKVDREQANALVLAGTTIDAAGIELRCAPVPTGNADDAEETGETTWLEAVPATAAAEEAVRGIAPWELAQRVARSQAEHGLRLLHVEPCDAVTPGGYFDPEELRAAIDGQTRCEYADQRDDWPRGPGFAWHLGPQHTQLAAARERADFGRGIRIAHIDTGYDPDHATRPVNLRADLGWNFHTESRCTIDRYPYTPPTHFGGHGTGTLALLAGNRISTRGFDGFLGGAPLAEVVPLVASPSVIANPGHPENFVQAIDRAVALGCQVIAMSMGGVPWVRLAEAVARAYDKGVVVVAAAGNFFCWMPPVIVAPAIFTTTIAAGGGMADHRHYAKGFPACLTQYGACYDGLGVDSKLVSGYSPNMPWAVRGCGSLVSHNGDGTSSSTPQVAAAAALWLKLHGHRYPANGTRVEACARALRVTAHRGPGPDEGRMGAGLIRASAALDVVPAIEELELADPSTQVLCPQARALPGFEARSELERSMLELELAQTLYRVPVGATLTREDLRVLQQQPQLSSALRVLLGEAYPRLPAAG